MKLENRLRVACILGGMFVAANVLAASNITPERYNKGPRILFNMHSAEDKAALQKVIPGGFHNKHWQTPRFTIQHAELIRNGKGGHVRTFPGYHGEEIVIMIEGQLQFSFPDNKQVFVLREGMDAVDGRLVRITDAAALGELAGHGPSMASCSKAS
jgi:hypothetical protein